MEVGAALLGSVDGLYTMLDYITLHYTKAAILIDRLTFPLALWRYVDSRDLCALPLCCLLFLSCFAELGSPVLYTLGARHYVFPIFEIAH